MTNITVNDIAHLTDEEVLSLVYDWDGLLARDKQKLPEGDWTTWLVRAGRGFGKTRIGSETVRKWCEDYPIIHLVGATAGDVRAVMIEGESGLLNVFPPHQRPIYEPSKRKITFYNGSYALLFTAEEPNRLRGPQCYKAWADELAAWKYDQETWDQLSFGMRLGDNPQAIVTTTPRPTKLVKEINKDPDTYITTGSTYENKANLSGVFLNKLEKKYGGTTLGRQEIEAEILEDVEGAMWKQVLIDSFRVDIEPSHFDLMGVALDPSASSKGDSDEAGIIVGGIIGEDIYILEDYSDILSPDGQSKRCINAFNELRLNAIVYEKNNGGDWIDRVIKNIDPSVTTHEVWASRGKATRAEPIVALYEQGKVHHVGTFSKLEDEMTTWIPKEGKSPNRVDALVWLCSYLTGGDSFDLDLN